MAKCYWITGLSASGKTTMANSLVDFLRSQGEKVILLDGDELRYVLSVDTYSREERIMNGMRYSRLCRLLVSQDVSVIIAVIGMFEEIYKWNRENIENYIEIFINVPMIELQRRDPKNLYTNFKDGLVKNIAGLDLKVDNPVNPHIKLDWNEGRLPESMFEELKFKLNSV